MERNIRVIKIPQTAPCSQLIRLLPAIKSEAKLIPSLSDQEKHHQDGNIGTPSPTKVSVFDKVYKRPPNTPFPPPCFKKLCRGFFQRTGKKFVNVCRDKIVPKYVRKISKITPR